MILEPWLVQHATELADQALTQLQVAAASVHHEAHLLLEEITESARATTAGGVNAGCNAE